MKLPALIPVKSSNIQALGWSDKTGLVVRFAGGSTYLYAEAPKSVFDELVQADSVGKAFGAKVKGVFVHKQVHDAEPHNR